MPIGGDRTSASSIAARISAGDRRETRSPRRCHWRGTTRARDRRTLVRHVVRSRTRETRSPRRRPGMDDENPEQPRDRHGRRGRWWRGKPTRRRWRPWPLGDCGRRPSRSRIRSRQRGISTTRFVNHRIITPLRPAWPGRTARKSAQCPWRQHGCHVRLRDAAGHGRPGRPRGRPETSRHTPAPVHGYRDPASAASSARPPARMPTIPSLPSWQAYSYITSFNDQKG